MKTNIEKARDYADSIEVSIGQMQLLIARLRETGNEPKVESGMLDTLKQIDLMCGRASDSAGGLRDYIMQSTLPKKTRVAEVSDRNLMTIIKGLCLIHPGCSPKMIFDGAIKKGLTEKQIVKLAADDSFAFSDLMFV